MFEIPWERAVGLTWCNLLIIQSIRSREDRAILFSETYYDNLGCTTSGPKEQDVTTACVYNFETWDSDISLLVEILCTSFSCTLSWSLHSVDSNDAAHYTNLLIFPGNWFESARMVGSLASSNSWRVQALVNQPKVDSLLEAVNTLLHTLN